MKRCKCICLISVVFVFMSGIAYAQSDASIIVCGRPITQTNWTIFSEGPGKPYLERGDEKGLWKEIEKQFLADSANGDGNLRSTFHKAITGLINGSIALSDFSISEDISGLQKKVYVFHRTPFQTELPNSASNASCQENKKSITLKQMATYVLLVQRCAKEIDKPYFLKAKEVIQTLEKTYDKYLYEGFPMYPWEALAASWLLTDRSIANGPPRNQIVLMHPAAGVIGAVGSNSDTDIGAVLSVEPFGWIRYNRNYSSWYGASILAVFPSDRNAGFGFALNYNNFKLGVTWHDYDNNNYENPTIFFGMDLYQFVSKKYRQYNSYKEKVSKILGEKN